MDAKDLGTRCMENTTNSAMKMIQNAFRGFTESKDTRIVEFGRVEHEKTISCIEVKKFDDHLKLVKDKYDGYNSTKQKR